MPPGTSPEKVLGAVQDVCREEFGLKHRYVMALHTDDTHPHVHVVLKATSEQAARLSIKKAHLKEWRVKFADHLRQQGVAANATPRQFRGQTVRPVSLRQVWRDRRENGPETVRNVGRSVAMPNRPAGAADMQRMKERQRSFTYPQNVYSK